jgi:hypothetical protein
MKKILMATALFAAVWSSVASADGSLMTETPLEPTVGEMAFDTLIGRPLGVVTTVGGTALWLVQLPISVWVPEYRNRTYQKMIVDPAKWTFDRPIGDFDPKATMRPE